MDGKKIGRWIREWWESARIFKRLREAEHAVEHWKGMHECEAGARVGSVQREWQWEKMAEEQRERASQAEGQLDAAREQVAVLSELYDKLAEALACDGADPKLFLARIEELKAAQPTYFRRPAIVVDNKAHQERRNLERLLVLAGLDEQTPLWQVVLSYADEHERNERETALKPEPYPGRAMTDGERHYNAGRAASAYDFAIALRDLYREAQLEGKKRA